MHSKLGYHSCPADRILDVINYGNGRINKRKPTSPKKHIKIFIIMDNNLFVCNYILMVSKKNYIVRMSMIEIQFICENGVKLCY